jgi:hypothetical protein
MKMGSENLNKLQVSRKFYEPINITHVPFQNDQLSTQPSPVFNFFCTFADIKKPKNICIPRFTKIPSQNY